jgi:hypothetical protein
MHVMMSDATVPLEKLLNDGWSYHDSEVDRLASELEAVARQGVESRYLDPFLRLSCHAIGEHLGDWARALRLGKHVLACHAPTPSTARAWGRLYVAAVLAGDPVAAAEAELSSLGGAEGDFGAVFLDMRFLLADALVGAGRSSEAVHIYRSAAELVGRVPQSPSLDRSIAVCSNNLGWELYEKRSRAPDEDMLMRHCAEMSLVFWRKCGDWINEERALYLRAQVSTASGNPRSGLEDAENALAIINAHGQRPLDAALLHLARATSLGEMGDADGRLRAIDDADMAASKLVAADLKARFDTERARIVARPA